jgi:hypothetical protein
MDYKLLQRRNRKTEKGREVWLVAFYEPDGVDPVLTVTNNPRDLIHGVNTYIAYNLSVEEPPSADGEGLPTASLVISNVTLGLQSVLVANDYFRNGQCIIIPYNVDVPDADYSGDSKQLQIISHETTLHRIKFTLAVPKEFIELVPEDTYGPSCRHRFGSDRCGYVGVLMTCGKTLKDCVARSRQPWFGATPGLRPSTIRVGV